MGRIKTQLIKRLTHQLVRQHSEDLTENFDENKKLVEKFMVMPSKKIRNVVAGYATRLMKNKEDI